jgi:hypothetical protein
VHETHICTSCGGEVPAHSAVLRGCALTDEPTAWHRWCWELVHAEVLIPAPRASQEVAAPLRASS